MPFPTNYTFTKFASNPVIDVDDNPLETHEQYVPAPIVLTNGDIWIYCKGSYDIYAWKSTDGGETFSLQNGGVAVIARVAATWESNAVVEPAAVYDADSDTIHIWYKGTNDDVDNPGLNHEWDVGYATAPGTAPQTVTKYGSNPILTATQTSGDLTAELGTPTNIYDQDITSVIKIGATWYFYGYVRSGFPNKSDAAYQIVQWTGATPQAPVSAGITVAIANSTVALVLGTPSVFRLADGRYGMFHTYGSLTSTPRSIRLAFSNDGSAWTMAATDVLAPVATSWEGDWVYAPGLLKINTAPFDSPYADGSNRWLLYYSGLSDLGPPAPVGHHANTGLAYIAAVPEAGFWVDWDEDGFADDDSSTGEEGLLARIFPEGGGTVDDNITADVRQVRWQRGGQGDVVGGSAPDSAVAVVKNSTGKYNPDNVASPLYGRLRPGRPVWFGANADGTVSGAGTVYGIFAGKIRDIIPLPEGGISTGTPEAEIICDGILEDYARVPTNVVDSITRSQSAFRTEVLSDIGETRTDLDVEADTLPISSADSENALSVLESLNRASGTRHFIRPQSIKDDWYKYTTRNRMYKVGAAADSTLDAASQHVTSIDGWRLTAESVINRQRATVDPLVIPVEQTIAWEYGNAPFDVSGNKTIWADFGEYVANPELRSQESGAALTKTLTSFGHTGKIDLFSPSSTNVLRLYVVGQAARREQAVTVTGELIDGVESSKAAYGVRTGQPLSGDLLGAQASAQGIVDHITWRFMNPLMAPRVTVENWFPDMLNRDLYDLLGITVAQLDASAKKFEIIGLSGVVDVAASASVVHWTVTYTLREAHIQGTQTFFTLNTSTLNGSHLLGY